MKVSRKNHLRDKAKRKHHQSDSRYRQVVHDTKMSSERAVVRAALGDVKRLIAHGWDDIYWLRGSENAVTLAAEDAQDKIEEATLPYGCFD